MIIYTCYELDLIYMVRLKASQHFQVNHGKIPKPQTGVEMSGKKEGSEVEEGSNHEALYIYIY